MTVQEQEEEFQRAFDIWECSNYTDKKAWERMWIRVHEACSAIGKKMMKGISNPMLEDRVMDAAIYYMDYIQRKKVRPRKLSAFCYLGTKGKLYSAAAQREDLEVSYEEYSIYKEITPPEEVKGICRKELMCTAD